MRSVVKSIANVNYFLNDCGSRVSNFFLWSSEEISDGGKMFIVTLRLIRIFLKTEIFFAVFISLPSVPTAHSKTQVFENGP